MLESRYPGIGVVGGEQVSALYGVDNGIVDWQGVGIQHLFYKDYQEDLVHSGVTFLKHEGGEIELGNRYLDGKSHPVHQHPDFTDVENGFLYRTGFHSQKAPNLSWIEEVYADKNSKVHFETTIYNHNKESVFLEVGSYVILRNPGQGKVKQLSDQVLWEGQRSVLGIALEKAETVRTNVESPTGFVFRTIEHMRNDNENEGEMCETEHFIGVTLSRKVNIPSGEKITLRWAIAAKEETEDFSQQDVWRWKTARKEAGGYWGHWIAKASIRDLPLPDTVRKYFSVNMIAIKAAVLEGFVPADITGHYFSTGSPCYYARDAMMIARAFLISGYLEEAKSILEYLIHRPTKENSGEFFQRYNVQGEPSEGANNNVDHQLDSQGYFLRNIFTYYQRTGEWLLDYPQLKKYVEILYDYQGKEGMIGPEGGVNEGVFGPAYITSSNMFIYGGLMAAIEIATLHRDEKAVDRWKGLASSIDEGIQTTWLEEGRYGYGYVVYSEDVVPKYDTPQFFGPLYGYTLHERMLLNNKFLLRHASFYENGIGYTEQEYHHGPWIFNTAACTQIQALLGNVEEYEVKVDWMIAHANGYGLMPEAIDAHNENHAFINPLTWACAEFVSSISILTTEDGFVSGKSSVVDQIWKDDRSE